MTFKAFKKASGERLRGRKGEILIDLILINRKEVGKWNLNKSCIWHLETRYYAAVISELRKNLLPEMNPNFFSEK